MHREELFRSSKQLDIDEEIACCSLSSILNYESSQMKSTSSNSIVILLLSSLVRNNALNSSLVVDSNLSSNGNLFVALILEF